MLSPHIIKQAEGVTGESLIRLLCVLQVGGGRQGVRGQAGRAGQRQGSNTESNSGADKSGFEFWLFLCSSASLKTLENREQVSLCLLLWRQNSEGK